jgi:hypothetical protein
MAYLKVLQGEESLGEPRFKTFCPLTYIYIYIYIHIMLMRLEEKNMLPAVIKHIEGFNCFRPLLFVAEDEVDPFVQMLRYILTLL